MQNLHQIAREMIEAAIEAVNPYGLIARQMRLQGSELKVKTLRFNLADFEHIYVIGAGKASAPMALAVEDILDQYITDGAVIVKYGHGIATKKIKILEAGHPVPDENTLRATGEILRLAQRAGKNDLVIVLLSGGGSALLESLPKEISLSDLQKTNQALLACGAAIEEINTIRKHISLIKGGQLAQAIFPAVGLTLVLSDVIGDPLESIASGPTVADPSTFARAWQIVEKYRLQKQLPASVLQRLQKGLKGELKETPKPGEALFNKMFNLILGNNFLALQKAANAAQKHNFQPFILTDRVQGEVREIAKLLAGIFATALQQGHPTSSPACFILGGEPTVTLKGKGKGGRNQEMVLAVLKELAPNHERPFYFCSLGTDGTDGPTNAAGAWIDQTSRRKAEKIGLKISDFLEQNDSYHFFEKMDQLIITGPTGTNVMDLLLFLF